MSNQKKKSNARVLWLVGIFAAVILMTLALAPQALDLISNQKKEQAINVALMPAWTSTTTNNYIQSAKRAFQKNAFQQAADLFTSAISQGYELSSKEQLYYAISLAKSGETMVAEQQLKQVAESNEEYRPLCLWYLANLALNKGQKSIAKGYLQQYLSTGDEQNKDAAGKLLKKVS